MRDSEQGLALKEKQCYLLNRVQIVTCLS